MAHPIFKIKKNISTEDVISGITQGELFVNLVTNTLYIGSTASTIPICGEVDPNPNLTSISNSKIPTQKAVKTYIDNIPQISVNGLEERKTVITQNLNSSPTVSIKINFTGPIADEISGISYLNGNFTNISNQTMAINVSGHVAIRTTSIGNARIITFIQRNDGKKFGANTYNLLDASGVTGSILDFNSTFNLNSNQNFSVFARHDVGSSIISGGVGDVFQNKISIYRLS
jgi:hypothetical protein